MAARFRPHGFLIVTWAVNVCSNAFYISPAPVFRPMMVDLGISNAQAGALISVYLVTILLFQIPAGYVIDRHDPRRIIVAAALINLGLSLLMYFVPQYGVLFAARALAGIPVAFLFVPSAYLVSQAFADRPGRAVGLFLSGPPAGVALGNFVGPSLAVAFGWPSVFIAFTLPWIVLVPLFAMFARPMPLPAQEAFGRSDYLASILNLELWKVGAVFACSYAAYIFYSSWSPSDLSESGIASAALLGILSGAIPAAGILSRPIGGNLAEGGLRADKRWVPAVSFVLLFGIGAVVPFLGLAAVPLLIAAGFLANFPFSVYYILSAQILPRHFTGTAYAFMNTISLIGGAIAPALAGYLVDVSGSFLSAFVMIAATALVGLLLLVRLHER